MKLATLPDRSRDGRLVVVSRDLTLCSDARHLAPTLQAAAALRLRHPSLSLRELAARADPPLTKAALAGRLARLVELVNDEPHARARAG